MSTQIIPAHTVFSTVSQADADSQAAAQASHACPICLGVTTVLDAVTWTVGSLPGELMVSPASPIGRSFSVSGSMTDEPGQTRVASLSMEICNATNSPKNINVAASEFSFSGALIDCFVSLGLFPAGILCQASGGSEAAGGIQIFTVPPNTASNLLIQFGMGPGLALGNSAFSATIQLTEG